MTSVLSYAAIAITQAIELSWLVKSTAVLLLGLAAARMAVRASAAVRHLVLAATFAALVVLPLAAAAIPGVIVEVPVTSATPVPASAPATAIGASAEPLQAPTDRVARPTGAVTFSWRSSLHWIWAAGVAAVCVWLAAALVRLRRLRRRGLPRPELRARVQALADRAGVRRAIDVLEHEGISAPLTCGLSKPVILLPVDARDWTDAELRRALVHELEHVRRGDWAVQLAVRAVCAVYWFHPLAWTALRLLSLEAERACDDAVVGDTERTDYADQLVLLARRLSAAHGPAVLGMAHRSDLATRVRALLDDRQRRGRAGRAAALAASFAAAVIVTVVAPVRAVARADAPPSVPAAAANEEQNASSGARRPRIKGVDRALYEAAHDGELDDVEQLLGAGANANAAISGDGSPLIAAARAGYVAIARRLLDAGADPNMPVPGDGSPLIAAAAAGSVPVVTMLLERGAEVDRVVPGDENALIQACGRGHLDIVRLLVARGADVNARIWSALPRDLTGEWRTPLGLARRGGHQAIVKYLLSVGAHE